MSPWTNATALPTASEAHASTHEGVAPPTATPGGHTSRADSSRYAVIERLGALRDADVLSAADFEMLKEAALTGASLARLDELERLGDLRTRDYITDHEVARLADEIVADNRARMRRYRIVLISFGEHRRKVEKTVVRLQRDAGLPPLNDERSGPRYQVPSVVAENLDLIVAGRWRHAIEAAGGIVELDYD